MVEEAPVLGSRSGEGGPPGRRMRDALAVRFGGLPVRVLVAEDNIVNQKVAARMLEKLGMRPDLAANGGKRWRCSAFCPTT